MALRPSCFLSKPKVSFWWIAIFFSSGFGVPECYLEADFPFPWLESPCAFNSLPLLSFRPPERDITTFSFFFLSDNYECQFVPLVFSQAETS